MSKQQVVWMNGEMRKWENAQIHVMAHALHYGYGFFEGIRAYKTPSGQSAIFKLREHIKRLFNSAKVGGITIPHSIEEISQACIDVMKQNRIAEGYIRPVTFLGLGSFGLYPAKNPVETAVAAWEWGPYLGKEALEKGIKTKISTFARYLPVSAMAHTKMTGAYALSVMAKMEAINLGYEEAILLDADGYVAEGSAENIFIVNNNQIITPPRMAILPGITRDTIMTLARELGYQVIEERFSRDLLYLSEEAFFTGTGAEITPICSVDDKVIGAGKRGPVTKLIQDVYFKCVRGEETKHQDWLTYYDVT